MVAEAVADKLRLFTKAVKSGNTGGAQAQAPPHGSQNPPGYLDVEVIFGAQASKTAKEPQSFVCETTVKDDTGAIVGHRGRLMRLPPGLCDSIILPCPVNVEKGRSYISTAWIKVYNKVDDDWTILDEDIIWFFGQ